MDQRIGQAQVDDQRRALDAACAQGVEQPLRVRLARQRARRLRDEQAQRRPLGLALGQHVKRVFQHPVVDLGDAAGQFSGRDHLRGGQQRAVGLAHAQQHLVLRLLAAGDGHDGLVGQLELPVLQRDARGIVADLGRDVLGHAVRLQPGLQHRTFDRLQRTAGVGETQRQRGIAHRTAQLEHFVGAGLEIMAAQPVAHLLGQCRQRAFVHAVGQHQEAVVVQARHRVRRRGGGQLAARLVHQVFEHRVAVALAQAQRAIDLDEEQTAARLPLQRVGQVLQHEGARGQAGVAVDRGARGLQRLGALARALDAVGDRRDQVAWPDRLVEEIVGAAFQHLELALRVRVAGQEHDRQVQVFGLLAQQHGQRHAVLARHVQVHQHQVGAEAAHRVQ